MVWTLQNLAPVTPLKRYMGTLQKRLYSLIYQWVVLKH